MFSYSAKKIKETGRCSAVAELAVSLDGNVLFFFRENLAVADS